MCFHVLGSAGLSTKETWAGLGCCPCLSLPPIEQKKIWRKKAPADLFAVLFFNSEFAICAKETTFSFAVNPSLMKALMTKASFCLRALKETKNCHKLWWNMFHHDPDYDVSRLSCACTGEESDSRNSVFMFTLTPWRLVMTRQAIINHY